MNVYSKDTIKTKKTLVSDWRSNKFMELTSTDMMCSWWMIWSSWWCCSCSSPCSSTIWCCVSWTSKQLYFVQIQQIRNRADMIFLLLIFGKNEAHEYLKDWLKFLFIDIDNGHEIHSDIFYLRLSHHLMFLLRKWVPWSKNSGWTPHLAIIFSKKKSLRPKCLSVYFHV